MCVCVSDNVEKHLVNSAQCACPLGRCNTHKYTRVLTPNTHAQGVEERPVNSAKDIFDILQGTNKQRRTAETLCNKQSSRSHSIFTLRIFMKEKTVDEEELIKTGTLNLVDLAGSECVGRYVELLFFMCVCRYGITMISCVCV